MATPDFAKIWASNSPLPAYTFSDSDYLTGWDFVGSAPPTKNEFDAWFKLVDTKLNWLYNQMQDTASKLYPVGSVYISFNSADPSTLFGGTWQRLKDTFLLASGDTYAANTTGGSATKTIAINNMPAHNHSVNASGNHSHTATTSTAGNHNHTATTSTAGNHSHTATTSTAGNHSHTATTSTAGNHSHTRGSMNITGQVTGTAQDNNSGAFDKMNGKLTSWMDFKGEHRTKDTALWNFDASKSWTGSTSTEGNHTHTLTTTTDGNHTHTLTIATDGNHTHTLTTATAGNHTHTLTTATAGNHTHTLTTNTTGSHTHTTNNTGGGLPLNILPPYQTVYMWRRTA